MKPAQKVPQKSFTHLFLLTILMSGLALAGILWSRTSSAQTSTTPADFDAVRDFNGTTNTANQVWQYGYTETNGSGFSNYTLLETNTVPSLTAWLRPGHESDMAVAFNSKGQDNNYNICTTQQADVLGLFPGNDGRKSVVRWKAPAGGTYCVEGRFQDIDQTTSDIAIVQNGNTALPLFSDFINDSTCNVTAVTKPFSVMVTVNAGDTIDFRLGWGSNNQYSYDGTGLAVKITNTATATPTPTPLSNGQIVFQRGYDVDQYGRGGQLYKIDPISKTETLFGGGNHPNYSPDGTQIVFDNQNGILTKTSAATYSQTPLLIAGGGSFLSGLKPKWSPDATLITYQSISNKVKITGAACTSGNEYNAAVCNSTTLDASTNAVNSDPAWLPKFNSNSGSRSGRIVFVRQAAGAANSTRDIYATDLFIEANGVAHETGTVNLTNSPAVYQAPAYSPDGTKIIYTKGTNLWLMNADGTQQHEIGGTGGSPIYGFSPSFSPDGKKITYGGGALYTADLVINSDNTVSATNFSQLTTNQNANGDDSPSWAPGTGTSATPTPSPSPSPTPSPSPSPSPSVSPSPSPTPIGTDAFTLSFNGKLRDRVSNTKKIDGTLQETATGYDGRPDGVFTITLSAANKGRTITGLKVEGPNAFVRNTDPANSSIPVAAIADTLDSVLLNNGDGSINVSLGATNKIFVADDSNAEILPSTTVFKPGAIFTLTITFAGGQTASASATVGQIPTIDLGLRVSAQDAGGVTLRGSVASGQQFRYYADVTNYSSVSATNPILVVDLPQGIVFDSSDQATPCKVNSTGRTVICTRNPTTIGTAESGTNHFVSIFYVHATQAGSFETTAATFSDQPEPVDDTHPNKFTLTTTTNTATDLAITVDGDSNPVQADAPLIYTARVINNGPLAAPNTQAVFVLDSDTVYVQYQDQSRNCAAVSSRQVICTISNLPLGVTIEKFQVRAKGTSKQVTLKASVTSGIFDYDTTNNNASVTTSVVPNAPPINDNFPSALNKLGNYLLPGMPGTVDGSTQLQGTVKGTNVGASTQSPILYDRTGEIYHADKQAAKSVWYVWQPPTDAPGSVEFSTAATSFDGSRSTFDTTLEVRATSLDNFGSFPVVAANDNVTASDSTSKVSFDYRPDQIYIIAVDGAKGATGFIALHWNVALKQTPALPQQVITNIYPAIGCTKESDQSQKLCQASLDAATGYHIIHVTGTNFTAASQMVLNKAPLEGFDNDGKPINGFTSVIYNRDGSIKELEAHLPPNPAFESVKISDINVVTPVPAGASTKGTTHIEGLPDGNYLLAANTGQEKSIVLKNATIPYLQTQTVCGHLDFLGNPDDETCIDFTNDGTKGNVPVTVNPVYFEVFAYCSTLYPSPKDFDKRLQCSATNGNGAERLAQALGKGFAINPQAAIASGIFKIAPHVSLPASAVSTIGTNGNIGLQLLVGAGLITQDGGGLVASGGGNLIGQDGGGLVASGGGNLVASGGGNLVASGGGNLVASGGGNLVASGGGNFTGKSARNAQGAGGDSSVPMLSASDLASNGSRGWFLVRSSGNANPTYDSTTNDDGSTSGKLNVAFDNTSTPRIQDLQGLVFAVALNPAVVQFDSTNVTVDKATGKAIITLTRIGDTSVPVAVDYSTNGGTATERSDYLPVSGTIMFAADETTKQITVPLINNRYSQADAGATRTVKLIIGNPVGGAIMMPNVATINITNNNSSAAKTNPLDDADARFFVRQHYLDFLNREPDQGGFDYWASLITKCAATDAKCIDTQRISVSAAFFIEQEFQDTGSFIVRTYKATLGRQPNYAEFTADRNSLIGGTDLEARKTDFVNQFATRQAFLASLTNNFQKQSVSPEEYVNFLNTNAGSSLTQTERDALVNGLKNNTATAASILRAVVDNKAFGQKEYNNSFVLMQYFGYLKRDPDTDGYKFWLDVLNNRVPNNYRSMVCAFITSAEYQLRFSSVVSRTDKVCAQ